MNDIVKLLTTSLIVSVGSGLFDTANAETRFLNLSVDSVAGRKVKLVNGQTFTFYNDHTFEFARSGGKPSKGTWTIKSNTIGVTYKGGRQWDYFPYLLDGVTYLKAQSGRSTYEAVRVDSIVAAE